MCRAVQCTWRNPNCDSMRAGSQLNTWTWPPPSLACATEANWARLAASCLGQAVPVAIVPICLYAPTTRTTDPPTKDASIGSQVSAQRLCTHARPTDVTPVVRMINGPDRQLRFISVPVGTGTRSPSPTAADYDTETDPLIPTWSDKSCHGPLTITCDSPVTPPALPQSTRRPDH